MIDVLIELLKVNRHKDNKRMEGEFKLSSASLKLERKFRFQMISDNLTAPTEIEITLWKDKREFCKASGDDVFYMNTKASKLKEPQKIALRALDEILQYFFGVHPNAPGVPTSAIATLITQVPDDMAMEILAVAI
jgi:hypothetical protein